MRDVLTPGQMLAVQARLQPDRIGARDLEREMTFRQWNARACRLANGLLGLGLRKGERVAVLAYNCVEWLEIYAAMAKAGLVAVPINFRLVGPEVRYILEDAEVSALILQDELAGTIEEIFSSYEDLIGKAREDEPGTAIDPADPWMLMYTSGTTGKPKGAIRSHRGAAMLSMITDIELGVHRRDSALLVMPMCHANSLYFFGAFSYCGGVTSVYSRKSFDPEHCVRALAEGGASFTSLVPTHYAMMLGLSQQVRSRYDLTRITRLMISSAPARPDTKRAVMEFFPNSGLYELYGATEVGWATMLHPPEQFTKLGSVGRECVGSAPIRLLDEAGNEVADGEAGELYCNNPYLFDGYWKLPEKTKEAFRGEYCTVGDMARRDADGFIHLVDRKSNMIISGGENIYPSEVEALLGGHPAVHDVAVVGLPDETWGERVHAVIVLRDGATATEAEILGWCKDRLAGFKRPRTVSFLEDGAMPRTATGKNLHRKLKERLVRGDV
jgi:fatty-acyl-CoA synthase